MKLLRSTAVFSGMTLLSRIAGYARDMVQAGVFGATAATDAFLVAYRIPNFLRRIFAEGSFAQAFVPVLAQERERADAAALRDFVDHVAGALCAVVLVVTALGMLLAPALAALFAPGALDEPEKLGLIGEMLRITFPYLFFIALTAFAGAILNSHGRFGIPAVTPVLHNLAVIAAALWLAPHLRVPVTALAWGVLAAGVVQLALQWWALRRIGVRPRPRLRRDHAGVKRVFRLMLPTLFGSSVAQLNLLVGTAFASLLVTGSQTWLYLAERLLEFPQGMIGVALGTVILPHLSRRTAAGDAEGYGRTLDWAMRMALLVAVPATLGLVVLAEPITTTLYQYGRFTPEDARMAALALIALAAGLPGFMLAKVLAPAFYARQDPRTPVRAGVITVVFNVLLTVAIVTPLWWYGVHGAHAGIALATSLAGTLNAWLLWRALRRGGLDRMQAGWGVFLLRLIVAGAAMATLLASAREALPAWTALDPGRRALQLGAVIAAGAGCYAAMLWICGLRPAALRER